MEREGREREREIEIEIGNVPGRGEGYTSWKNEAHESARVHVHIQRTPTHTRLPMVRYNPSGDYSVVSHPPILR